MLPSELFQVTRLSALTSLLTQTQVWGMRESFLLVGVIGACLSKLDVLLLLSVLTGLQLHPLLLKAFLLIIKNVCKIKIREKKIVCFELHSGQIHMHTAKLIQRRRSKFSYGYPRVGGGLLKKTRKGLKRKIVDIEYIRAYFQRRGWAWGR